VASKAADRVASRTPGKVARVADSAKPIELGAPASAPGFSLWACDLKLKACSGVAKSTVPAAFYPCGESRFVSASPHEGQTKTCSSGIMPRLGTLRISFITWPQPAQSVKGRLSGRGGKTNAHLLGVVTTHPPTARSVRACAPMTFW
jgi:hypothetical protein